MRKKYIVEFVVEGDSLFDALNQAEQYLNTGKRCIDCNVSEYSTIEPKRAASLPMAAPRLEKNA